MVISSALRTIGNESVIFASLSCRHKLLKDGFTSKEVPIDDGGRSSFPVSRSVSQLTANSMVSVSNCADDVAEDTVI